MSHFSLLVVGKDVEGQLAPFNENLEMDRYVKYTKEELIANEKKEFQDYLDSKLYKRFLEDPDKYIAECKNQDHVKYITEEVPIKKEWTDEQWYAYGIRYYESDEIGADGEVYSTYNPKSKWDWYSEGGRYSNKLLSKSTGQFCNSLLVKDLDLDGIKKASQQRFSKIYDDGIIKASQDDDFDIHCPYFGIGLNKNETKEEYVERCSKFCTFAVLKDGEWYERGEMGWFAIVSNEKGNWEEEFEKLFMSLDPEEKITVIDCHI